jgi:small-conductance mechanosensitive channel/CRP-like cAMP-binding protein
MIMWLSQALWGSLALLAFLASVFVIRTACRRPPLGRLTLALSLLALAGSVALLRALVPWAAEALWPYLLGLLVFSLVYTALKVVEILLLDVVARRRGEDLPPAILRDVVSGVFAAIMLVVILRVGFGVDVTALVATSAALSIILGLALQETLANVFAGLALILERPFEPGDWIQFGSRVGQVKEINWRAVKLQILKQDDFLIIPNSVVAKTEFVNMSRPPCHGSSVDIAVMQGEAPNRVCRVLAEAAREVEGVIAAPEPVAVVLRFDPYAIVYRLMYWVEDYARLNEIQGAVLAHAWYALRRHGMRLPLPTSHVYSWPAADVSAEEQRRGTERVTALLRSVDFLGAIDQAELQRLATRARVAPFPEGAVVVRQGESGDSLYVVVSGRVQVLTASREGGPEWALATLRPGDYFGEMSLLTGAPRSATVRALEDTDLLVLDREALRPLLVSDPAAAERLSETLAKRQGQHQEAIEVAATAAEAAGASGDVHGFLLARIRRFFGLGPEG